MAVLLTTERAKSHASVQFCSTVRARQREMLAMAMMATTGLLQALTSSRSCGSDNTVINAVRGAREGKNMSGYFTQISWILPTTNV